MSLEMDKQQSYKAFPSVIPCFVLPGLYLMNISPGGNLLIANINVQMYTFYHD